MEVTSVLNTHSRLRAHSACEELRVHAIKCDTVEPGMPDVKTGGVRPPGSGIQVVVAPEDESRAREVLSDWLDSLASADPS
jgi:DUF971 family protein